MELERCLRSLKDLATEIVAVVDPAPVEGDRTDEILSGYGAKEILLPWPGDYRQGISLQSIKDIS